MAKRACQKNKIKINKGHGLMEFLIWPCCVPASCAQWAHLEMWGLKLSPAVNHIYGSVVLSMKRQQQHKENESLPSSASRKPLASTILLSASRSSIVWILPISARKQRLFSVSGLLHLAQCPPISSMLWQTAGFSFSVLNVCIYTPRFQYRT